MLKDNVSEIEPTGYQSEKQLQLHEEKSERNIAETASASSHSMSGQTGSSFRINNSSTFLQKFELGLENKDVTIVGVRLNNFGKWMKSVDNKEIVSVTTSVFQIVQQLAKPGKGQVGNFENGSLSISFNAAISADSHELKGCNIAKALTEKLTQLNEGKAKLPFTINCAVVTDSVACGNLGTREIKTFTIIGDTQNKIQEMLNKNLEFEIPITINEKVQKAIKDKFLFRSVELARFCNNQGQLENLHILELGESTHVNMDEWMYEMEQKESKNKWNNYNTGYNLYMDGNYAEALQHFKEHIIRNPNDKLCKKMIELCEH
ncbi:hypothetical protein ABK040_002470 [Willaertia magna]